MTVHILALETSSSVCGVALLSSASGSVRVHALEHDATGEHAERLLPMAEQVMQDAGISRAELSAIAFGQGPGGFTGLRVACGVAQGIGYAMGIPVLPIASLLAVAERDRLRHLADVAACVVVQDARMGEVYLAAFRAQPGTTGWEVLQEAILINASDVAPWLEHATGAWNLPAQSPFKLRMVGDALDAYPSLHGMQIDGCSIHYGEPLRADAPTVAALGLQAWHDGIRVAPDDAMPLYVRDKVAYTTRERELGAGGNPRAEGLPVRIETMHPEHLDDVAEIERRVQSFPWTQRNFADGLLAGYAAYVATQGGRTLGFYMALMAPDVAHLLVVAVAPEQHGTGIGARLLDHCEQLARSHELPAVLLEVRPSNQKALDFYLRRGYQQLSTRRDYYPAPGGAREDACVMQKKL